MATFSTRFLGCKVSFADAQAIRERLLADGHLEVSDGGGLAKFVALRVVDAAAGAATPCTLVLASGLRLEMAALPSPAWLLALDQAQTGAR